MKINKAKLQKFEAVREVTFRRWAASGLTSEVMWRPLNARKGRGQFDVQRTVA